MVSRKAELPTEKSERAACDVAADPDAGILA